MLLFVLVSLKWFFLYFLLLRPIRTSLLFSSLPNYGRSTEFFLFLVIYPLSRPFSDSLEICFSPDESRLSGGGVLSKLPLPPDVLDRLLNRLVILTEFSLILAFSFFLILFTATSGGKCFDPPPFCLDRECEDSSSYPERPIPRKLVSSVSFPTRVPSGPYPRVLSSRFSVKDL